MPTKFRDSSQFLMNAADNPSIAHTGNDDNPANTFKHAQNAANEETGF